MTYGFGNYNGYGYYNPYMPPQQQPPTNNTAVQSAQNQNNVQIFPAMYVSSINEVESIRPDQNNNPMYFHNRAGKEIYLKQYDNTGAAPIKTFRLIDEEEQKAEQNVYETGFNVLNSKIDGVINLLQGISETSKTIPIEAKGGKKQNA